METFQLFDERRMPIPIEEGFPEKYISEFAVPGSIKYHAYYGKYPLLFQAIKVGHYEIVISDYLTRKSSKITCKSNSSCLEIHFILTGKVLINLRGIQCSMLEAVSHNMIALYDVKNETYFKKTPVSTLDIHFTEEMIINLAKRFPQLSILLNALKEKTYRSLFIKHEKSNLQILHLLIQIKAALMAGLENEASTLNLVETLIIKVLENKPINTKYQYDYHDIEKIQRAHKYIEQYLDEKDILANKIFESKLKPDKFREGFRLLFGQLPGKFLQQKRLEKAHALAIEGRSTTLEDIAQFCGYLSMAQLSKAYLKLYGTKLSAVLKSRKENSK